MNENEEACNLQILDECLGVGRKVDAIRNLHANTFQPIPNCMPTPNLKWNSYRDHHFTLTDEV